MQFFWSSLLIALRNGSILFAIHDVANLYTALRSEALSSFLSKINPDFGLEYM